RSGGIEDHVALAEAQTHLQRQISVRALDRHRELAQICRVGCFVWVYERNENLGADVAGTRSDAPLILRQQPRFAPYREVPRPSVRFRARGAVERQEGLLVVGTHAMPGHAGDVIQFEVHRTGTVRQDVKLVRTIGHRDPVRSLGEEIDNRRAEQREVRRIDYLLQDGFASAEQQDDLELVRLAALDLALEPGDVEKQEALRKGKILLQ